ncbi:MAG: IS3 family transposase [Anaerovoracaceae bacterium]
MIETPPSAKYEIIQEMILKDDNKLTVVEMCKIAQVSRSGYYNYIASADIRKEREEQDRRDFELILTAYNHRGYDKGARGIYMRLLHLDPPVNMNLKKIRRLMKKYGLVCPIRKANPYRRIAKALKTSNTAENLLNREFEEHGARKVLLTDITYIINGKAPRCYMSTIIDGCTKELLSWVLSESLEIDFVLETVNNLIKVHGISLSAETLIHSDQGAHYTSVKFIELVKDTNLRQSMSRRANCWDNAPQESFYGHMKDEIDISWCDTFDEIQAVITDWTDYYNNDRYQWDLAKLSPVEYYDYLNTGKYPLTIPKAKGK